MNAGDCSIFFHDTQWLPAPRVVNERVRPRRDYVGAPVCLVRVLPDTALPCVVLQEQRLQVAQVVTKRCLFDITSFPEGVDGPYVVDSRICPCHLRVRMRKVPRDTLLVEMLVHLRKFLSVLVRTHEAEAANTSCQAPTPKYSSTDLVLFKCSRFSPDSTALVTLCCTYCCL